MSILHADNFSIYGATEAFMLNGIYAEVQGSLVPDPDGISPGFVLSSIQTNPDNGSTLMRFVLPNGAVNACGFAFRHWLTNLPGNNNAQNAISIRDGSNVEIARLWFQSTGIVNVSIFASGSGTYTEYATAAPVTAANGWYHFEWWYQKTGATTADFEVRIEGVTVLDHNAVVVDNRIPAQVSWPQNNISKTYNSFLKDFVVADGNGTYNNTFMGSVLVTNLVTTSDVALNWGLVGGAAGWSILDNIPPVDASYVFAEDAPLPSPYRAGLSDLPVDTTTVRGLITFVRAAKSDGGDGSLQVSLISGASTDAGADRPITIAQSYWRDVSETDPATTAPWLPSAVNAVNLQMNRTT